MNVNTHQVEEALALLPYADFGKCTRFPGQTEIVMA